MRSKQLFAVGLIFIGLGVPRLVDAVEIAYGLDIRRDIGVLPWYIVTALGVALFLWHLLRAHRSEADRQPMFHSVLWSLVSGLTTVLVALVGVWLLGRSLVDEILASGGATAWLAVRGLVLFAGGVGVVIGSARSSGRSTARGRAAMFKRTERDEPSYE